METTIAYLLKGVSESETNLRLVIQAAKLDELAYSVVSSIRLLVNRNIQLRIIYISMLQFLG